MENCQKKKKKKKKVVLMSLTERITQSLIFINVTSSSYVFLQKLYFKVSTGNLTDIPSCVLQTHTNVMELVIQIIHVILKPFQAE